MDIVFQYFVRKFIWCDCIIAKIPKDLQDHINHFNCNNVKDLRMRLVDTHAWEREYDIKKHHDLD